MEVSIHIPVRSTSARVATLLVASTLWLFVSAGPLRAESPDRQVAEWVVLVGGSVRLEGQIERIREVGPELAKLSWAAIWHGNLLKTVLGTA